MSRRGLLDRLAPAGTDGAGDASTAGRPDLLRMRWRDLLFAHWPVSPGTVAERLPPGLAVATRDGDAYLGVVPFEMADIRPRGSPVGLSFPELNLRTYVEPVGGGPRGVYFFSLDAAERLGVSVARRLFELPYYRADMRLRRSGSPGAGGGVEDAGTVTLVSRRRGDGPPARYDATYRPTGEPFRPEPGSLEAFLVENYAFYAAGPDGGIYRGDIAHEPWTLRPGTVETRANTLFEAAGVERPAGEPLVHHAAAIDVTAGRVRRVDR